MLRFGGLALGLAALVVQLMIIPHLWRWSGYSQEVLYPEWGFWFLGVPAAVVATLGGAWNAVALGWPGRPYVWIRWSIWLAAALNVIALAICGWLIAWASGQYGGYKAALAVV